MSRKDKTRQLTKKRRTKKRRTNQNTKKKTRRRSKARQEGGELLLGLGAAGLAKHLGDILMPLVVEKLKEIGDMKCDEYAKSMKGKWSPDLSSKDINNCRKLAQELIKDYLLRKAMYGKKWQEVFLRHLKEQLDVPDQKLSTLKGFKSFIKAVKKEKDKGTTLKILSAYRMTNEEMKKDKSVTSPNPTTPSSLSKIYKGLKDKTRFGKKSESSLFQELELEGDAEASYDEWMRGRILNSPLY
jgi:hypothetical protein